MTTLVNRLRGLGTALGRVANRDGFTPSERGRSAAEIAVTVLEAADALEAAEWDRDAALDRVEELENEAERVSAEFEGDCWKMVRRLLDECNFEWDLDGCTADQAETHILETLQDAERRAQTALAHANKAEAENARLREALVEADQCFEAAYVEGFADRLGELDRDDYDTGGIGDLIERRILPARETIVRALSPSTEADNADD